MVFRKGKCHRCIPRDSYMPLLWSSFGGWMIFSIDMLLSINMSLRRNSWGTDKFFKNMSLSINMPLLRSSILRILFW